MAIKKLTKKDYKKLSEIGKENYEWILIMSILFIITGVGFIIGNSIGILKNTYTPEVVVIEQVQQMREWNS